MAFRLLAATLVAAVAALSLAAHAQAPAYPNKPVRIIVPSPPGDGSDLMALAVTTAQRSPLVPDIPTIAESGLPGFETVAWFGLFAPAGTPREIVDRIQKDVATIVQMPDIKERIVALGGEPVGNAPEAFAAIVKSDIAKWKDVAKKANIRAD